MNVRATDLNHGDFVEYNGEPAKVLWSQRYYSMEGERVLLFVRTCRTETIDKAHVRTSATFRVVEAPDGLAETSGMDVDKAMQETMKLLRDVRDLREPEPVPESMRYVHLLGMERRWSGDMSVEKKNRWLGWMQASVCALYCLPLDIFKEINRRSADQ